MFARKSLIALAAVASLGAFSSASFANELGFTGHPSISTKARADVAQEAQAFAKTSVQVAGLINSGEAGLEPVKVRSVNSPKAETMKTAAEVRLTRDLYIGG